MALDIDYFRNIQGANGCDSKQDIVVADAQRRLTADLKGSINYYPDTTIDGTEQGLVIIQTDNFDDCKIQALPGETFDLGNLVVWTENDITYHALVIEVNAVDRIQTKGKMRLCNHEFKFQNGTPDVLSVWGIIENPYSRYYSEGRILSAPYNQLKFTLPYNDDTKKIFKNKRLAIETGYSEDGVEIPIVYKVVNQEAVVSDYGNGKLMTLMVEFDNYNASADSLDPLIADYIAPGDTPPTPVPAQCSIAGPDTVRAGRTAMVSYTGTFVNSDGEEVSGVTPVWIVEIDDAYEDQLTTSITDGILSLKVGDEGDIIGETITIALTTDDNLYGTSTKQVEVVDLYG